MADEKDEKLNKEETPTPAEAKKPEGDSSGKPVETSATDKDSSDKPAEKPAVKKEESKYVKARNLGKRPDRRGGRKGGPRKGRKREPREFEQKILDLARVTRVTAGGKRMSFRCALVIGDKKGRVGFGMSKGADVQISIEKAYKQAKKNVIRVPIVNETIPHPIQVKVGSAVVMLKPAPKGTGLKSGGAIRMILEHAGVPNAVSKILNSSNKANIAKATMEAIRQLHRLAPEGSLKEPEKKKDESEAKDQVSEDKKSQPKADQPVAEKVKKVVKKEENAPTKVSAPSGKEA